MTDEKLIEKIKKDPEVFGEIIDRYQKKLERYIFYLIGDKNETLDLVQEVFIKVYINLNGFVLYEAELKILWEKYYGKGYDEAVL
jgi:RNA polymerase sigma-70 factor (ECF subfamily)